MSFWKWTYRGLFVDNFLSAGTILEQLGHQFTEQLQYTTSLTTNLGEWQFPHYTVQKHHSISMKQHSVLMTKYLPSIHKLYIRFFNCWCCNPEILYALLPIFWGLGIPYWSIPIFVILRKQIPISFTQSQHFLIFFIFLHGRDCVDCLLPSKLLLFWWQLCYVMLCYVFFI